MKAEDIEKLNEFTNSIAVLKLAIDFDDYRSNELIRFYRNYSGEVTKERLDALALIYADKVLINGNDIYDRLFASFKASRFFLRFNDEIWGKYYTSAEHILSITDFSLYSLIADIFVDSHYIDIYGSTHINLINLLLDNINQDDIYLRIIKKSAQNCVPYVLIERVVNLLKSATDEMKEQVTKFIMAYIKHVHDFDYDEQCAVLDYLDNHQGLVYIEFLTNLFDRPFWRDKIKFKEICSWFDFCLKSGYKSYSLISNPGVIKFRRDSEILEMLIMLEEYPDAACYVTDHELLERMSWSQQKELFLDYRLDLPENYNRFNKIKKLVLANGDEDLFLQIKASLDKESYVTTVADYLNTCASIKDFINDSKNEVLGSNVTSNTRVVIHREK